MLGIEKHKIEAAKMKKVISKEDMAALQKQIFYSDKYCDDEFEYRHVMLPKEIAKFVPKDHLMTESEWRGIGVQQSHGWVHFLRHDPEPHILLFRRKLPAAMITS